MSTEGPVFYENATWYKLLLLGVVLGPFVALIVALMQLWNHSAGWKEVFLLVGTYIPISLGVTVGLHRLATHRAFEAHWLVELTIYFLAELSLEGKIKTWAENHIKHHQFADKEGDPHSPHLNDNSLVGFLWAHLGWLFFWRKPDLSHYARHLEDNVIVVTLDKLFPVWIFVSIVGLPYLLGGWQGVLWGGLVRIFFVHHVTWSVNSVCHVFGSRKYTTDDKSKNNWVVALLGNGEGYHNNHHAFPRSVRQGLIDLSCLVIKILERFRLAWNLQYPDKKLMEAKLIK